MDPASSSSTLVFGRRLRAEAFHQPHVYSDTHDGRFGGDDDPALNDYEWDQPLRRRDLVRTKVKIMSFQRELSAAC
ncbi:hypothetical protein CLCR_06455 [Cladophialophora carrionii]|uniref:Uncharacterized protein n=1 Tax=Cladophialophora carrionii TaxID=86049 RepID=A0A1C1C8L1_9EURO|nr:hypothetical protein CLCR_06455 [Cladophialophora carrionii]